MSLYIRPGGVFKLIQNVLQNFYLASGLRINWLMISPYVPLHTTKKTKIREGYLVRENVKSLSNSVTKFCDQGICEEFHFFRH